jgi:hypothetical protein
MKEAEIIQKAIELDSLSEHFTLSHAVLATAKMIEDQKKTVLSLLIATETSQKTARDFLSGMS